jgi:hypothetical protein
VEKFGWNCRSELLFEVLRLGNNQKEFKGRYFSYKAASIPNIRMLAASLKLCGPTLVYRTHRSLNISIEGQFDCPSGLSGLGLDFIELKKH